LNPPKPPPSVRHWFKPQKRIYIFTYTYTNYYWNPSRNTEISVRKSFKPLIYAWTVLHGFSQNSIEDYGINVSTSNTELHDFWNNIGPVLVISYQILSNKRNSCVLTIIIRSKGVPQQAEVAQGVPGRLRPQIFLTFRHYKGGRSSAKRTGRLYSRRNPWYSLSEAESTSGHKIPNDITGNRSRDLPTSSASP